MLGTYRENLKVQRLNFCKKKKKKSKLQDIRELGEDGGVGRPRAHILSKAHQKHNYLPNGHRQKRPGTYQRRPSTTKDIKKD